MNDLARFGPNFARKTVAIVGGGFSGAAIAYHVAQATAAGTITIVVFEPRKMLGAGLAYSTLEPAHRINVPASKMSLVSDDGEHFARWLSASGELGDDPQAVTSGGDAFPQRSMFGRYVADHLAAPIKAGRIRHERSRVEDIRIRPDGRFDIRHDGGTTTADIVALATTHPLPAIPGPLRAVADHPGLVCNPYDPAALGSIAPDSRVLIIGNGLTAADVVAMLDRKGHRGCITALSRHGFRSRGHAATPQPATGDFSTAPARTALSLLRRVRRTVVEAGQEGFGWQAVIDKVRSEGQIIWSALPVAERVRLVRHLRTVWDVHRFRIAPQVEAVLERRAAEGRFRSIAAQLVFAQGHGKTIEVAYRLRRASETVVERFDAVVNTTGPAHRSVVEGAGALSSLHEAGLLRLDTVGLGLDVAPDGRAVGRDARAVDGLYVGGPLARGTFGELMGLPEVTRYAEFIAAEIAHGLAMPRGGALDSIAWKDRSP
ncbi:MAG: FAD/NAD(P)-binding protein [Rhizobiaceae bacterium]|nr:FAD/NAD(P)-binding protein [Rhizobiaceae bacterium]